MKWILSFFLLTVLNACETTSPKATSGLLHSGKVKHLDSLFEEALQQQKIPGAVALIAQGDELLYHKAFGCRDMAKQIPQKNEDIFRIASMTKPITAVAVIPRPIAPATPD